MDKQNALEKERLQWQAAHSGGLRARLLGSRSEHQSSDLLACVLPVCLAWPTAVAMAPRAGLKAAFPGMFSSPARLVHEIL